ncbi:MAG: polyprenyl synthetase family protein, partial [Desulfatiglandales bacterium]
MEGFDLKAYAEEKRKLINSALESYLPEKADGYEKEIVEAMRYSLFAGGKRLRPILCLAGSEAVGGTSEQVLPFA